MNEAMTTNATNSYGYDTVRPPLQAVCRRCGGPATMTQGLVDGAPAPADGATIVVGALEQYEARCRSCHELVASVQIGSEA